ncbi:MAG TPA: SDR family NAD(P)-dependent oxidoreductase, partial [Nitrospiria bacterium]|nr:SDR family NAD(P)-dependent oxidoreductase [Nitrospiria bacterium]
MNIDNKIVVVTGASSGIGLATVKLLASRGAKLALVSRSKDKLDAFSRKISGSIAV